MCGLFSRTLLSAALLLSGWASFARPLNQNENSEQGETAHLRGVVINGVTREPIGHALVFSPDNRFATMSDGQGRFEFSFPAAKGEGQNEQIPIGALRARKPGFLEPYKWSGGTIVNGEREMTITLTPEAVITGRVTLASAEPSDRIGVVIYRREVQNGRAHWVNSGTTTTKSNGEFRFADLAGGTYKLFTTELLDRDPITFNPRGQQYGYPPAYFSNTNDFASASAIQLTAGTIFQADISIARQPYYQIKIPVMNAAPNMGMEVIVSAQGRRGPGYSLGYDSDERVITGLLPNGTYALELASNGQNAMGGQITITVKGGPVEGPPVALASGTAIGVNVHEEFTPAQEQPRIRVGSGVHTGRDRSLSVWLDPADDFGFERGVNLRPQSKPGDDALVLENAHPGRYWARVSSSRGYVASVISGNLDLLHQPLVVTGGSTAPIEVTLKDDFAEIAGTVEGIPPQPTGSDGFTATAGPAAAPSPSAFVYCVPSGDNSGEFREIPAGPDGSFMIAQIPPGTYRLLAFDGPQRELEYSDPEAMRAYDAKGQVVRLGGGQKESVRLQLIATTGE